MVKLDIRHVNEEGIGKRIDSYLADNIGVSRTNIQRLIENRKNFCKW